LEAAILPSRQLHRKDIIVFKYPRDLSKDFVKRVIALEGEQNRDQNKQVYINDRPIDEPYKVHNDSQIFERVIITSMTMSSEIITGR